MDHLLDSDVVWDYEPTAWTRDPGEQADMLSLDKDGRVEDHCADEDINGDCGHTHYQFKAVDANGKTVVSELVETQGSLQIGGHYFQSVFSAEKGDLTLSVSLGRMVGGKYKAMSDTASVTFEAPDDLRALDQTYREYYRVLLDIVADYDENEELQRWLGENKTGANRSIWNREPERGFSVISNDIRHITRAHLNNQWK